METADRNGGWVRVIDDVDTIANCFGKTDQIISTRFSRDRQDWMRTPPLPSALPVESESLVQGDIHANSDG